jgi:hypothetical protein
MIVQTKSAFGHIQVKVNQMDAQSAQKRAPSSELLSDYCPTWQWVRHDIWARPIQQWRWSTTVSQRVAEISGVGSAWREERWGFDDGSHGGLDVQGIERCEKHGSWSGLLRHRLPRITLSNPRLSFRPTSDPGQRRKHRSP